MASAPQSTEQLAPAAEFHLLGRVDFDVCQELLLRLSERSQMRGDGRIDVLLCEHPPLLTVGRRGSRAHIQMLDEELQRRRIEVRWVGRSGGCVLHGPGQLAIHPIVPLTVRTWSASQYLEKVQTAIVDALADISIQSWTVQDDYGVWGRSGLLAACGTEVVDGVARQGAYINVNPANNLHKFIDTAAWLDHGQAKSVMGSLLAERRQGVKMTSVRAALVARLAEQFGCPRYHLHTGHPLLRQWKSANRESTRRQR